MHCTLNFIKGLKGSILFFVFSLMLVACKQEVGFSEQSNSALIQKVNAVQQQMMKQGNISESERQAILDLASLVAGADSHTSQEDLAATIPLEEVEKAPAFPTCEELSGASARSCFIEKLNEHIATHFNAGLAKELGITKQQKVEFFFKINKAGAMENLKVRDANVGIQAEVARVIRNLPTLQPATQNGEVVEVLCSAVITYGEAE